MCTVEIRQVVGVDTNGDNERDEIIVVGIVDDCPALHVALFDTSPPAGAQIADGVASRAATILAPGISAHGVTPTGDERVFTVTFTQADSTNFKGRCGTVPEALGILAACDNDDRKCRDPVLWEKPIDCGDAGCPVVSILVGEPDPNCVGQTRSVSLSFATAPFSGTLAADVDFGDGTASETINFSDPSGFGIGQAITSHPYSVPGTGTSSFQVTVTIAGRRECVTTLDVEIDKCPSDECPVDRVTLRVDDSNDVDVTSQRCLSPGRYVVSADIDPAGATTDFKWDVDGVDATVGQSGVFAITGAQLTIDLTTSFRSVSVIAAGCASGAVPLWPCEEPCCPDLTGLSASCMPRCPRSTTVTFTAAGSDLECAEAFDWEFGDGTTAETAAPTTTHIYESFGVFNASVTIVRPRECGRPRTQRQPVTVKPCPVSCFCAFLATASGLLLLALLALLPLIACSTDGATTQVLLVAIIIVVILLIIAVLWWYLDACCQPTRCELARILFWVFTWALIILSIITMFCGGLVVAIPFGIVYALAQQLIALRMINDGDCGPAPDILTWPFPACR